MRIKHGLKAALLGVALAGSALTYTYAADLWENWSIIGGPSYCSSFVTGATGQICQHTVPAGEAAITGYEFAPMDLGPLGATSSAGGPQSGIMSVLQLNNGLSVDLTTVATSQTIGAYTSWTYLDGAQGSAFTVTMPASPYDGQFENIVCEAATVGVLTVAANTTVNASQAIKLSPGVACVAGVSYQWRYTASNSTWYRTK